MNTIKGQTNICLSDLTPLWRKPCRPLQVEEILGDEPEVKERLFDVLKQYATERDVESLACILPEILITEEHQQLIESVRYYSMSLRTVQIITRLPVQSNSPDYYK